MSDPTHKPTHTPSPPAAAPAATLAGRLQAAPPDEARSIPARREELVMLREPRGQFAEQFRSLRNSIHALNPDGASHTLVMTSAVRGEGKTVASLNLAIAMGEMQGTQVLVVDADLHNPSLERYLELPPRKGLSEVLSGTLSLDQALRTTSIPGVSILGAGSLPANPSELLGSDRMRAVLNRVKQRFSYVIIDTPQASTISDASLLGAMADGILLVVRLMTTPRHMVQQTYNTLEALGGNVLGTCLTGAHLKDSASRYAVREEDF